jgi:iron complex outermembrane receptor protein
MGPDKNNNVDSLNYHGGESSLPKNLQVLVDGRSMYRAGLASVSWYEMPVAIADIDRIEVVRGPNSASYGANAYQAVINILTKHPSDTYGTTLSFEAGENGQEDVFLRQGGRISETDYRVSYTQKNDDGFSNSNDTRNTRFLNFDSYKHLGSGGELELSVVVSDSERDLRKKVTVGEGDNEVVIQTNDNEVNETRSEVGIQWTKDFSNKHQLSVKSYITYFEQKQLVQVAGVPNLYLDSDLLALNALSSDNADILIAAVGSGNLSAAVAFIDTLPTDQQVLATNFVTTYSTGAIGNISGDINANLDEFRFDIELQDTYIYNSNLTFVSGVSFRRDVVDSEHYFDGELYSNTSRMFGSITWKPNDKTNLHLGGMIEKEEFSDSVFSPRAAINYKISPSESLRYVYSESVRSPDFFEQFANWTLEVENVPQSNLLNGNTFYKVGRGPGMIEHQKIVSNELGYYGRLNDYAAELDVRLFHEAESKVLYQSLSVDDFIAENDNTIDHFGIEWQVQVNPFSNTLLRMTAAYVEVDTSREDNGAKLRVYAKETATATWMQGWGSRVSTTLNYFIVKDLDDTNVNSNRTRIERFDGRISKGLNLASIDADIYMNFQHDISSDTYLWDSTYYTDSTRLVLGASVAF